MGVRAHVFSLLQPATLRVRVREEHTIWNVPLGMKDKALSF